MTEWLVGLDDTDAGDSIGTGALAREAGVQLARKLGARSRGVTRHQLLIHPDIPYTTHNSSACLAFATEASQADIADLLRQLLDTLFHPGADPGLCVIPAASAPQTRASLEGFGRRAQTSVVSQTEALALAEQHEVLLEDRGGTGLGVIGALSACGLRLGGNDGRFISLGDIRSVPDLTTVGAILADTPVDRVVDTDGRDVSPEASVLTRRWVRPNLRDGQAVLQVEPATGDRHPPVDYVVRKDKKRGNTVKEIP